MKIRPRGTAFGKRANATIQMNSIISEMRFLFHQHGGDRDHDNHDSHTMQSDSPTSIQLGNIHNGVSH